MTREVAEPPPARGGCAGSLAGTQGEDVALAISWAALALWVLPEGEFKKTWGEGAQ